MSPEEAFAELEQKVARQERAIVTFLTWVAPEGVGGTVAFADLEIAAGAALNVLNGVEE